VHVGDQLGGAGDLSAQLWRVNNLGFSAQGKDVEDRGVGRVDPDPGFEPVLRARRRVIVAADPDARWPAGQCGEAPAAR
jgi:hypothetical protein